MSGPLNGTRRPILDADAPQTLLLHVTRAAAGHVATALRAHAKWAATTGIAVPAEVRKLEDAFACAARSGQERPRLDGAMSPAEPELVPPVLLAPRLVTTRHAAAALGVSERQVRRLTAAGALPAVHVGGSVRIRVADLDRYVDQLDQLDQHDEQDAHDAPTPQAPTPPEPVGDPLAGDRGSTGPRRETPGLAADSRL